MRNPGSGWARFVGVRANSGNPVLSDFGRPANRSCRAFKLFPLPCRPFLADELTGIGITSLEQVWVGSSSAARLDFSTSSPVCQAQLRCRSGLQGPIGSKSDQGAVTTTYAIPSTLLSFTTLQKWFQVTAAEANDMWSPRAKTISP